MKTHQTIATALLCLTLSLTSAAEDHLKISIKTDGDRKTVNIGDELFTAYNYKDTAKPYLYPIIGPTGANMTRHFPMKKDVEGEADDHEIEHVPAVSKVIL